MEPVVIPNATKRGRWSKEETMKLDEAVEHYLPKDMLDTVTLESPEWLTISEIVATRNATQCFKRWHKNFMQALLPPAAAPVARALGGNDDVAIIDRPPLQLVPVKPDPYMNKRYYYYDGETQAHDKNDDDYHDEQRDSDTDEVIDDEDIALEFQDRVTPPRKKRKRDQSGEFSPTEQSFADMVTPQPYRKKTYRKTNTNNAKRASAIRRNAIHPDAPAGVAPVVIENSHKNTGRQYSLWTEDEDNALRACVQEAGHCWTTVCSLMLTSYNYDRNETQCRERWTVALNPEINRGPWTRDEHVRLLQLQIEVGPKWVEIAERLGTRRAAYMVKNRWRTLNRNGLNVDFGVTESTEAGDQPPSVQPPVQPAEPTAPIYPTASTTVMTTSEPVLAESIPFGATSVEDGHGHSQQMDFIYPIQHVTVGFYDSYASELASNDVFIPNALQPSDAPPMDLSSITSTTTTTASSPGSDTAIAEVSPPPPKRAKKASTKRKHSAVLPSLSPPPSAAALPATPTTPVPRTPNPLSIEHLTQQLLTKDLEIENLKRLLLEKEGMIVTLQHILRLGARDAAANEPVPPPHELS